MPRVRANVGSSTRNMLRALSQHEQETSVSWSEWFRPSGFSRRLIDCVTFAFLMDSVSFIISSVSDRANEYINTGLAAVLNGLMGIAPTLIPFVPQLVLLCQHHKDPGDGEVDAYREELNELFAPVFGHLTTVADDVRQGVWSEIDRVKEELVERFVVSRQTSTLTRFETFINAVYVVMHGLGSALILVKGARDLQGDDSDDIQDISKWMTVGSTAAYLIYYLVCLLPRRIRYCTASEEHEAVESVEQSNDNSPPDSPESVSIDIPNPEAAQDPHAAMHQSLLVSPSPN
jgi:hypothetical protein